MPKTIIVRKTWRCSYCPRPGPDQWDTNALEGQLCPICKVGTIRLETNPAHCGTLTVMGVEAIEPEIAQEDAKRVQQGLLVQTEAEKTTYRDKRTNDIARAIAEARKREYVP